MKKNPLSSSRGLLTAAFVLLFCPLLHAIPVRVLAWDEQIASMKLSLKDSKGSVPIDGMHPTQRTKVYQVAVGETPAVIETLDKKNAEGKPLFIPVSFPESVKKPLIIILPDEKAPTGIRPTVLEDDEAGFAWGSMRFVNATGKPIVFVHENKGTSLPPSWDPVMVQPGGDQRSMSVKLFFREQPQQAIYSATWEHQPEARILIFLVPGTDPRLGPVATKMITEDRRILAAEQALKQQQQGGRGTTGNGAN